MDLSSYLMEPVQRFMRYPLLLKEVIKLLKDDDDERGRAETSHATIERVRDIRMVYTISFQQYLIFTKSVKSFKSCIIVVILYTERCAKLRHRAIQWYFINPLLFQNNVVNAFLWQGLHLLT